MKKIYNDFLEKVDEYYTKYQHYIKANPDAIFCEDNEYFIQFVFVHDSNEFNQISIYTKFKIPDKQFDEVHSKIKDIFFSADKITYTPKINYTYVFNIYLKKDLDFIVESRKRKLKLLNNL